MTPRRTTSSGSLYELLAEDASGASRVGETITTRAKETVDNDIEAFAIEEFMRVADKDKGTAEPTLYGVLAELAPTGAPCGETIFTATTETVDRDQEGLETTTLLYGPDSVHADHRQRR
jgi:hypothetical protein